MAFDPALPLEDSEIVSAELRSQFNGLKALLDQQIIDSNVQAVAEAAAASSANSNGVDVLSLTVADPPTQADVQAVCDKLNQLILALRR